jgi:hypothetical protein
MWDIVEAGAPKKLICVLGVASGVPGNGEIVTTVADAVCADAEVAFVGGIGVSKHAAGAMLAETRKTAEAINAIALTSKKSGARRRKAAVGLLGNIC